VALGEFRADYRGAVVASSKSDLSESREEQADMTGLP
jgi:hypothetical protein